MESGKIGNWSEYLNKYIKIIFEDSGSYPKKKEGILISETPTHLILKINSRTEAILLTKILRAEL